MIKFPAKIIWLHKNTIDDLENKILEVFYALKSSTWKLQRSSSLIGEHLNY